MVQPAFYTSKDVARRMAVSPSWVRGQRHKRAKGLPHIFTVDARQFGGCVRYDIPEVEAFIEGIGQQGEQPEGEQVE